MNHKLAAFAGLGLAMGLAAAASAAPTREAEMAAQIGQGRALAAMHCATCHATGERGRSRAPTAPPFRSLRPNAPIEEVVDGLTSGLDTGHPMMPRLVLSTAQSRALSAYIRSMQQSTPHRGASGAPPP